VGQREKTRKRIIKIIANKNLIEFGTDTILKWGLKKKKEGAKKNKGVGGDPHPLIIFFSAE